MIPKTYNRAKNEQYLKLEEKNNIVIGTARNGEYGAVFDSDSNYNHQ